MTRAVLKRLGAWADRRAWRRLARITPLCQGDPVPYVNIEASAAAARLSGRG